MRDKIRKILSIILIIVILTGCKVKKEVRLNLNGDLIEVGHGVLFIDTSWYVDRDDYYEFDGKLFPPDRIILKEDQILKIGNTYITQNNYQHILSHISDRTEGVPSSDIYIVGFNGHHSYDSMPGYLHKKENIVLIRPFSYSYSDPNHLIDKFDLYTKPINICIKIYKTAITHGDNADMKITNRIATPNTILGHTITTRKNHIDNKGVFKIFTNYGFMYDKESDERVYEKARSISDITITNVLDLDLSKESKDEGDYIELEANTISCKDYYRPMPTDNLEINDIIKTCQDVSYKIISKTISETSDISFKLQNINDPNIVKLGEFNQKTGRIEIDGEETKNTIKISKNAIITDLYGNELVFNDLIKSKKNFQISVYDIEKDENDIITKIIDCSFDKVYNIYNELVK